MPVTLLFCEGGPKSPDMRVLAAVLAGGACTVREGRGIYGFGQRILIFRAAIPDSIIAGLCDRDFDDDDTAPTDTPREWRVDNGKTWLGWRWERQEIENYVIDPVVVERALGPRAPETGAYRAVLQASAGSISDYTAARTALSLSRVRFSPLENAWGSERGRYRHKFPDERQETDCRNAISTIVRQYEQAQIIKGHDILKRFDALLPTCRPSGTRFQHFMTFFAGKDLLFGMQNALVEFGLGSPFEFRERILKGIENSPEDVWTWLPEWSRLRDLIRSSPIS